MEDIRNYQEDPSLTNISLPREFSALKPAARGQLCELLVERVGGLLTLIREGVTRQPSCLCHKVADNVVFVVKNGRGKATKPLCIEMA